MAKDEVFKAQESPDRFRFDKAVASVFDDMIVRSVPGYQSAQGLIAHLAAHFARPGRKIYDLGCSSGNTLLAMDPLVATDIEFVACDGSKAMLDECRRNLSRHQMSHCVKYLLHDLNNPIDLVDASVVILSLVLQFIDRDRRSQLIAGLHKQLQPGGVLIIYEKTRHDTPALAQALTDWHLDYKRASGYSELEIARKKQALENVLLPLSIGDNMKLLRDGGFKQSEIIYCLGNFFAAIAVK